LLFNYPALHIKKSFLILCLFFLFSCGEDEDFPDHTIEIKTNYGNIFVELYPEKAPQTVASFISYIDSGIYKNSNFYRVLKAEDQPSSSFKSELIQGGIYISDPGRLQKQKGIPLETTKETGLHHLDGTISLARTTANSASTEFFICIGKQPAYDLGGSANIDGLGYAAFGKVIKGMDVVKQIHEQPSYGNAFTPPVIIKNIVRLRK